MRLTSFKGESFVHCSSKLTLLRDIAGTVGGFRGFDCPGGTPLAERFLTGA
jgi:hypothetical protein